MKERRIVTTRENKQTNKRTKQYILRERSKAIVQLPPAECATIFRSLALLFAMNSSQTYSVWAWRQKKDRKRKRDEIGQVHFIAD
jgi:hypothetical protein